MFDSVRKWRGGRARCAGIAAAALLLMACGVSRGVASPITYADLSGTSVYFTNIQEDSATDPTPLYGQPTITGDTLVFQPTVAFSSSSTNGGADMTDGRLSFTVQAAQGQYIQTISLSEFGDFALIGTTEGSAIAAVSGAIFGTDTATNTTSRVDFVGTGGTPPVSSPFILAAAGAQSGTFTGTATLDYTGQHVTSVRVVIDNTLSTVADPAAAAFISKKGFNVTVTTPEPASLALMGLGALMMMPRRGRSRRRAA